MHPKFIAFASLSLVLSACDPGVELGEQSAFSDADNLVNPFYSGEDVIIDDTESRGFSEPDRDTTSQLDVAQVQCAPDTETITADAMSFTKGFIREVLGDDHQMDAVRARNTIEGDGPQYIEVCVQSDIDRDYYVETLVSGPSVREDSFFFTVGESEPIIYDLGRNNQDENGFSQDFVRSRDVDPFRISLSAGRNILRFHYRERNSALAEVSFLRLPRTDPDVAIDNESTEFSAGVLQCASETGLEPTLIASLIDQHIPTDEFVFSFASVFNDAALVHRYFVTDTENDSARVFCARDFGPVPTGDGFQETVNEFFPTLAPTLILGSAGKDRLDSRALTDNVVFYGFGGDDSVRWQVGGQFHGGDENDEVIGLSAGFFDGESGRNIVQVSTNEADVTNVDVLSVTPAPQPLSELEFVGIDDTNLFVRWPNDASANITIQSLTFGSYVVSNSFDDNRFFRLGQRFGQSLRISARAVLELDSGVSLLSRDAISASVSIPTISELITQLDGTLIRGPERFDEFQDTTLLTDEIRWLSAVPIETVGASSVLIEERLPNLSVVSSPTREVIAQGLGLDTNSFDLGCQIAVGESTYVVLAQTPDRVEAFGFDADTLALKWQRRLSDIDGFDNSCRNLYYDDGFFYFENESTFAGWIETLRISEDGDIERVPGPEMDFDRFSLFLNHQASSASGTTAVSVIEERNVLDEFPGHKEFIVVVHQFDGSGTASRAMPLTELRPNVESDTLTMVVDTYTDGDYLWLLAEHAQFEHAVILVDLNTGNVLNSMRFEPIDVIFTFTGADRRMRVTDGVLEIGRNGRLIRMNASTLERLNDVLVVGEVTAFDAENVTTLISDDNGVSALSFAR